MARGKDPRHLGRGADYAVPEPYQIASFRNKDHHQVAGPLKGLRPVLVGVDKYTLESRTFPPLTTGDVLHGGTGTINNSKNLVDPASVDKDISEQLEFKFHNYSVTVMSFEIATTKVPNWFGVSFRNDIGSFNSVNIFCHPSPGGAGMTDSDYPTRSGKWPRLFRYAEMLGSQMHAAGSNQIVIVPFFNNASYVSTGIFGPNWKDIVEQILAEVRAQVVNYTPAPAPLNYTPAPLNYTPGPPALLKHVVLSDFSRGRALMWSVRRNAPGLNQYLREVWDFDGVGGPAPRSSGGVQGILYDQAKSSVRGSFTFHVPSSRWIKFHKKDVGNVHSNIPDMLAWHAASISSVR